jgi:allantoinase
MNAETHPILPSAHLGATAAFYQPLGFSVVGHCSQEYLGEKREALWAALDGGVIDCGASDHSPCVPELKRLDVGDLGLTWGGIASLQTALPTIWTHAGPEGTPW